MRQGAVQTTSDSIVCFYQNVVFFGPPENPPPFNRRLKKKQTKNKRELVGESLLLRGLNVS
jgi:hypothetical protein